MGRSGFRVAAAALVAAICVACVVPAADAAADQTAPVLAGFADIVVDPTTERVFVSTGIGLTVLDPDGALLGTVEGLDGAGALTVDDGHVWAVGRNAIAEVDPQTLLVVDSFPFQGTVVGGVAVVDGGVWYLAGGGSPAFRPLRRIDRVTGEVADRGVVDGEDLARVVGSTSRLLVVDRDGGSPYYVYQYDVSVDPAVEVADVPHGLGSDLVDVALTDHDTMVVAASTPDHLDELAVEPVDDEMRPTGVSYPGSDRALGVAYSPARGGVVASIGRVGRSGPATLLVSRDGIPVESHAIELPNPPVTRGVAVAADGLRVHVVTQVSNGLAVETFTLAPTLRPATPPVLVRGRATTIRVEGTGLGAITEAGLGPEPVSAASDGPGALELEVRTDHPTGPATIDLRSPFGDLRVPVTVVDNTEGVVSGTVRRGGFPVEGASVTLDGEHGARLEAVTGTAGTYEIADVPAGDHWDLTVAEGAASIELRDRSLTGSGPWVTDIDLLDPPATSLERRRRSLPPGEVRRLVVDDRTGRTFVGVGNEVVVFDPDGRLVGRIAEQWTVDELQVVGSTLFAMLDGAGTLSLIDTESLEVERTYPLRGQSTGSFAVTGDRVQLVRGASGWVSLAELDLGTGVITDYPSAGSAMRVGPVAGSPLQFLSWDVDSSSSIVRRWSAAGSPVEVAASPRGTFGFDPGPIVASSAAGLAWSAGGRELRLDTLAPTATTYPATASRAVAQVDALGGVIVVGSRVFQQGSTAASQELADNPAARALGLDPSGRRVHLATGGGELVVTDLQPAVDQIAPSPIASSPTVVMVRGLALGRASSVRIDGREVSFEPIDASSLEVEVPALADGTHELVVETPWGASTPRGLVVGAPSLPYEPFGSWRSLVRRLYADVTDAVPTPEAEALWVAALTSGSLTTGDLLEFLRRGADQVANVDPVVRLYRALLGRAPDPGGLDFWVRRRRSGAWTLAKMAEHVARSTEFVARYGTLTNRQFVTRIYVDVLERAPDPGGIDYWTRQLDLRRRTRGTVIVGFSESAEHRRKQADATDASVAHLSLLGRAPTVAEVAAWVDRRRAGSSHASLLAELVRSAEYRDRLLG